MSRQTAFVSGLGAAVLSAAPLSARAHATSALRAVAAGSFAAACPGARAARLALAAGAAEQEGPATHAAPPTPPPRRRQHAHVVPPAMTTRANTAVVTGASSSIGLYAAKTLVDRGDYHVVMAVRDEQKAAAEAQRLGFPPGSYTTMHLDLSSLDSVRSFVAQYKRSGFRALNALVCNAACWYPKDKEARVTQDGYDETVQVNHLGHFLLANLLLPDLKLAKSRIVFLATQTHNPDTLPGKIPPQADLGNLEGLASGFKDGNRTIDGLKFEPTKAYKDSKVCNILTMTEMHKRFSSDGVVVSAVFPGCIASSNLFREKRGWFRWFFPLFQKYITRQYVSVEEAGRRVACVAGGEGQFYDSGKYWQWRGSYLEGVDKTHPVAIMPTEREAEKAERLWELSTALVGLKSKSMAVSL